MHGRTSVGTRAFCEPRKGQGMELKFGCTACGRCCNTGPSMVLEEALQLAGKFVLDAVIAVVARPGRSQGDRLLEWVEQFPDLLVGMADEPKDALRGALLDIGEAISEQGKCEGLDVSELMLADAEGHFILRFDDPLHNGGSCPKRRGDGRCGIYEARPLKCRMAPLDELAPEHILGAMGRGAIEITMQSGGECRTDSDQPVIWRNGKLVDETMAEAYRRARTRKPAMRRMDLEIIDEIVSYKAMEAGISIEASKELILQGAIHELRPHLPLTPALHRLASVGALSFADAGMILEVQTATIERRMEEVSPDAVWTVDGTSSVLEMLESRASMYRMLSKNWRSGTAR